MYHGRHVGAGGKPPKPGKRSKKSETLAFNITSKTNLSVYTSCITKCIVLQLMGNSLDGNGNYLHYSCSPKSLNMSALETSTGSICQATYSNLLQRAISYISLFFQSLVPLSASWPWRSCFRVQCVYFYWWEKASSTHFCEHFEWWGHSVNILYISAAQTMAPLPWLVLLYRWPYNNWKLQHLLGLYCK